MSRARKFLLWSARILGVLLFLIILAFAFGESFPSPKEMNQNELMLSICLLMMMLGTVGGLFRAWIGASLLLIGSCAFTVINDISSPVSIVMLFLIDGILYLAVACCRPKDNEDQVIL